MEDFSCYALRTAERIHYVIHNILPSHAHLLAPFKKKFTNSHDMTPSGNKYKCLAVGIVSIYCLSYVRVTADTKQDFMNPNFLKIRPSWL